MCSISNLAIKSKSTSYKVLIQFVFSKLLNDTCLLWNAKLTETRIFRELSIEIEISLIELKSSLIQLKSSLIQLESSLIQLESSLIQLLSSLYMYNKRAH